MLMVNIKVMSMMMMSSLQSEVSKLTNDGEDDDGDDDDGNDDDGDGYCKT